MFYFYEGCPQPWQRLIGDGNCDDALNTATCNFDDGDCCDPTASTDYCQDCICHEDLNCNAPLELILNGYCNDETNTAECNFDGGDCCGSCANLDQCSDCECLDGSPPNYLCKLTTNLINRKISYSFAKTNLK